MSKILLIDDEANQGWKEILQKVFFSGQEIDTATTNQEAVDYLSKDSYDLVFLDLRYGEGDHHSSDLETFQGYKILTQEIRGAFEKPNFATPVILFTASNKIWNIHGMLEAGADSYYIKEHPDQSTDLEFSRQNFIRINKQIPELIEIGKKRNTVLKQVNSLIDLVQSEILNPNIRDRITEKLKIGYTTLFHQNSRFEKEQFAFNKELMAFISFWSILEEVAKDGFEDKWVKSGPQEGEMQRGNWVLRNGQNFIQDLTYENFGVLDGVLIVELTFESGLYKKSSRQIPVTDKETNFYSGKIGLPLQIYAVMLLGKGWSETNAKDRFDELIQFRNRVDFIHSSVGSIFNKKLSNEYDKSQAYLYCTKMLNFLTLLLNAPWI